MSLLVEGQKAAYAIGENAGTFVNQAADALGNFVCGLYRDYPGAVVDQTYPIIRDFGTGIMDGLCGNRTTGLPPARDPGFLGGQCACVLYNLTFRRVNKNPDGSEVVNISTLNGVPGKIQGVQKIGRPGDPGFADWKILAGSPQCPFTGFVVQRTSIDAVVTIQSVVRADGRPDDCGNPPTSYPVVPIPPARTTGNVTINNRSGGKLTIPVAYVPIKPELNVAPKFGFDLGGVPVTLDAGGFTFNLPDSPVNRLPGGADTGSGSDSGLNDKLDDLGDKVDSLRSNPVPCIEQPPKPTPGEPDLPPDETQPSKGKEEDAPGIKFLEVVLTKLPDKEHFGNGGVNVFFAGWIAFRAKSGGYYPREQINFRQSVFPAPEGADGYTVTFTNGAEGRVREYTQPVSEE